MPSKISIGQNLSKDSVPPQNIFTDREEPQQYFKQALEEINQRDYNLLVFYGVGGIGKSYLQAHLKQEHLDKDANSLYSSVNFENPDNHQLQKTLRTLVHNFSGEPKIPFTAFGLAYMIYWEKAFPDQDIKKAGLPFLEEGSMLAGAADLVDEVGGVASVAMNALEFVYNKVKQQAFDENLRDALKRLNTLSSEQIEQELPKYFAYDIDQYQAKYPEKNIAIFIDTHEALWQTKRTEANRLTQDQWLRDGIIAELPNVLFVISGREKIVWDEDEADNWGDYLNDRQHLLGNLSDDDARDFLKSCEITDADIQDKIIADSEGVPFYLDLCMETYYRIRQQGKTPSATDFATVGKHQLLERFMRYLNLAESETLKVLAHARFYTAELFEQLVAQFKTGYPVSALSQLNQFSFISEQQGRFFIHDLMQKSLIQHQDQQRNQAVNQYLFDHYNQHLQDLDIKQLSETSLTALPEAFHHKAQISGAEELLGWFNEPWNIFNDAAQYLTLLESNVQLLEFIEEELGEDHIYVGYALHKLAGLHQAMAKYEQAEPLFQRALEVRKKILGEDNLSVATTLGNMALLYKTQGKYEHAEPLYRRSLEITEKALGEDNLLVSTTLNNMAELYRAQGKYEQAEPLYQRSLKIREKAQEEDHPDFAVTLSNMALLYEAQGKYEQVEPLYKRSLEIYGKVLGEDHPRVSATLNNMALLYTTQGKYEHAESLYQRSLEIRKKTMGEGHPDVAASFNNLAGLYETQGKPEQAESLYQRSLEIKEKALGEQHPSVATTLSNMAGLYQSLGKYEQAEPLYQRSLEIRKKILGEGHPDVATALSNMAELYYYQEEYQQALPLFERALAILQVTFPDGHPNIDTVKEGIEIVKDKMK